MTTNSSQWLTLDDIGEILGVSVHTLRKWRAAGRFPAVAKLPNGSLRVRARDLDLWLESRTAA